uniref:Uncharacterized protein n=1 Tax=Arundo donax TaxID=35708 RepID=A0A0A9CLN8_ARUDO
MDENTHRYAEVDIQNRKASSGHHSGKYNDVEISHKHLEKSSKEDFVKEMKADHMKELESTTAEKYNNDDKYSTYANVYKNGSFKEEKGSRRIAKNESDTREPHSRGNSKQDDAKGDRKETRERNKNTTDRRGGRGKDEKDRSRQMTKSSTSHSSRRSRSRSPRGRSRTRKEISSHVGGSVSSDDPSESVKRRKLHSRKNSMSPSPPKSRNRYFIHAPFL